MRKLILATGIFCATLSSVAQAEQIQVPISQQGNSQIQAPQRGNSQQLVLSQYGEPVQRHASVGQPPITRWDYQDFSVYFEHQTVINSVKRHNPKTGISNESP